MVGPAPYVMSREARLADEGVGLWEAVFMTVRAARGATVDVDFAIDAALALELGLFHKDRDITLLRSCLCQQSQILEATWSLNHKGRQPNRHPANRLH